MRPAAPVPVLATYFSVRRGRDPFFKFFMRTIFPRQVKDYEDRFGIRFIGWYNVAHGWDFDNVILLDLPDYATLDALERDESIRAFAHRAMRSVTSSPDSRKAIRGAHSCPSKRSRNLSPTCAATSKFWSL